MDLKNENNISLMNIDDYNEKIILKWYRLQNIIKEKQTLRKKSK